MSDLNGVVLEADAFLKRSPVSIFLATGQKLPVSALTSELSELQKDVQVISKKIKQPLKVVIMGEVKAGKSTLINTLVGADVSPVDVKEATSSIIVIRHNVTPIGKIVWVNGDAIEGTPDNIYRILNENRGNMDFFADIKEIELSFPLTNLHKLYLVDTPGLATITRQNEETTINYMQEADVVLWLLNGNHLGQADVEEALGKIAKMGKPVIGVVNRIDEVDGNPDRLIAYVEQELGIYLQSIFPMSAYQAYHAMKTKNQQGLQQSGYLDLLSFLEKQIEAKVETVHKESILASVQALLRKNLAFHESYSRSLQFLRAQVREHQNDLDYHNQRIKRDTEETLRHWAEFEFMRSEKQEIHQLIHNMRLLSGKQEKQSIEHRLESYFSSENINSQLNQKLQELYASMQEQWQLAMDSIQEKRSKEFQEFAQQEQIKLELSLYESLPSGQDLALEGAGKGAAIAGAWGATAAAYAAWFGPYASTVTIGAAAGAILPPLLIAGAITGAVAKLVSFKRQKQRYQNELDQAFNEAKREITSNILPRLIASIREINDDYVDGVQSKFVRMIGNNNSEADIDALEGSILTYTEENKMILNHGRFTVEQRLQTFSS